MRNITPCCYRTIAASAQRTAATKEAGKVSKAAGRSAERSKEARLLDLLFVSPPAARRMDARATDRTIRRSRSKNVKPRARPRAAVR